MKLDFAKLQGLGNDFIFIDDFSCDVELSEAQVMRLCDRHFGIGGDGVILVRPARASGCSAYMHYMNSDGTLAQMCGNGVRCFAKYLVDRGYVRASDGQLVAETLAGPKPIRFEIDEHERLTVATVDMGHPVLDPSKVPVAAPADALSKQGLPFAGNVAIDSPWGTFSFVCVSMGNPHAVCFIDDFSRVSDELFSLVQDKCLATFDLEKIGSYCESHELFPEKTNVEFAVVGEQGIGMRVYERGCGETLACGTGACATAVAAALTGRADRESEVHVRGGALRIAWDERDHVMMTGPAVEVFRGSIEL